MVSYLQTFVVVSSANNRYTLFLLYRLTHVFMQCVLPYRNPNIWLQDSPCKVSVSGNVFVVKESTLFPSPLLPAFHSLSLKRERAIMAHCYMWCIQLVPLFICYSWQEAMKLCDCLEPNFIQNNHLTVETRAVTVSFLFRVEWPNQQSFYKVSIIRVVSTWVPRPGFLWCIGQGSFSPALSCALTLWFPAYSNMYFGWVANQIFCCLIPFTLL